MKNLPIDFLVDYNDASILAELQRIASIAGSDTVTKADIEQHGRMSYELVWKRFGSLRQALQMAQLTPRKFTKASDDELLKLIVELWGKTLQSGRYHNS